MPDTAANTLATALALLLTLPAERRDALLRERLAVPRRGAR